MQTPELLGTAARLRITVIYGGLKPQMPGHTPKVQREVEEHLQHPHPSPITSLSQEEADNNEDPGIEEEDLLTLNSSLSTAKDPLDNGEYGEPDYD
ncbi:Keratinocyte-associated transmembrane protein 2 [Sciurus carolinensis]|uniref:Keratinocyte-associated transmembrane protein 2 n=1 Tax=Sciurus carolinensis TaxID=30640 RepID=A0AA41MYG8_SCICA|nr:Keratinocyte-associated transmembrane protein 2 [Sciurus carolinensis]